MIMTRRMLAELKFIFRVMNGDFYLTMEGGNL